MKFFRRVTVCALGVVCTGNVRSVRYSCLMKEWCVLCLEARGLREVADMAALLSAGFDTTPPSNRVSCAVLIVFTVALVPCVVHL